jgi:hypothetical protein
VSCRTGFQGRFVAGIPAFIGTFRQQLNYAGNLAATHRLLNEKNGGRREKPESLGIGAGMGRVRKGRTAEKPYEA